MGAVPIKFANSDKSELFLSAKRYMKKSGEEMLAILGSQYNIENYLIRDIYGIPYII